MKRVSFVKMHGTGNDFIVVDEWLRKVVSDRSKRFFVSRYCDRHFGVGADGVIFVQRSGKADARFVFYNPDGSRAEMCGNGIRCFAKYLYERGLVNKKRMVVETLAGFKTVDVYVRDNKVYKVKVDMGSPKVEFLGKQLDIGDLSVKVSSVNMGNPHAIVFVDNIDDVDVVKKGRIIRNHTVLFPEGVNVHFVQKVDVNRFRIRTYERGVEDETLACGTGICASAVAACLNGLADINKTLVFHALGGDLYIEVIAAPDPGDLRVYMTGPAVQVFTGEIVL